MLKNNQNMTCKKDGYDDLDMFKCDCSEKQFKSVKPLQIDINNKFFQLPVDAWMKYDGDASSNKC